MGFNSGFKGLNIKARSHCAVTISVLPVIPVTLTV
jgi:hypothetical protein